MKPYFRHGLSTHKLYNTWNCEKHRCNNIKNPAYAYYGGRGINFSLEFEDIRVWLKYVESLDNAYKEGYTLDRINNDGDYERGNLRWTPKSIQTQNTRILYKNNTSGVRGVMKRGKKWVVQIRVSGKKVQIGTFDTIEVAMFNYDGYIEKHGLNHTKNEKAVMV